MRRAAWHLALVAVPFALGGVAAFAQGADVPALIQKLGAESVVDRVQAVEGLLDAGPAAQPAIPALIGVLRTDDGLEELTTIYTPERVFAFNPVQNLTVKVLVNLGTPAVAPVEEALAAADPRGPQLSYLAEILTKMQKPETTAVVDGLLHDSRPDVRRQAADVLGYSKDPATVGVLIGALSDADAGVRSTAAASLETITGQKFGQDSARWNQWRSAR